MKQVLVILRGTACSGKTTLGEKLRNFEKRLAWLSVDKLKPLFSDFKDETLDETNQTCLVVENEVLL